jgi:3-deoxy-D-manno-octulosonate 8-phosphate phosphatase (KDO 8-P phosphatase)
MEELRKRFQDIRVFFCDADGVLFTGGVTMGAPQKAKERSYVDGQGVSLLRAAGLRVVFITNEREENAIALRETVAKWNSLPSSKPQKPDGWEPVAMYEGCGGEKKLGAAKEFLEKSGFTLAQAAYMGDDLVDAPLLKAVALPVAPASAEEAIQKLCMFVSSRRGGAGAIRDFANAVLEARGIDPLTLPLQ